MVNWLYYPRSRKAPPLALKVVEAFRTVWEEVDSSRHNLPSNGVLAVLAPHLAALGFRVEVGKTRDGKIQVPVLFGLNGLLEKSFEADAYHEAEGFVRALKRAIQFEDVELAVLIPSRLEDVEATALTPAAAFRHPL